MRIQFVRSGGFAGMRLAGTIDTSTLSRDEAQALQTELDNAHFFELPAQLSEGSSTGGTGSPERDRYQYEITVEDGGKTHTVVAGESAIPGNLRPLVQHLEQLVRGSR